MISGELRTARINQMKQIPGEPGVIFPTEKVGVIIRNGKPEIWVTMQTLIEVLDSIETLSR